MDSKSSIHKGQTRLRLMPLLRSVPRAGSAFWHNFHKKNLDFGHNIKSPYPLIGPFRSLERLSSMGNPSCRLVTNLPELLIPQQKKSSILWEGIGIPINFWKIVWFWRTSCNLGISHDRLRRIDSLTLVSGRVSLFLDIHNIKQTSLFYPIIMPEGNIPTSANFPYGSCA